MRKPVKKLTPEGFVKLEIQQILRIYHWFVFPVLQSLGCYPGISDFIAIKDGRVLFIEAKAASGTQSAGQKHFEQDIKTHGGEYHVVRSAEDMLKIIGERNWVI